MFCRRRAPDSPLVRAAGLRYNAVVMSDEDKSTIRVSESLVNHIFTTITRPVDVVDGGQINLQDDSFDIVIKGVKDKGFRLIEYRLQASFAVEVVSYGPDEQILDFFQTGSTTVEGRNTVDSVLTRLARDPLRDFLLRYDFIIPRPEGYRLTLSTEAFSSNFAGTNIAELFPVRSIKLYSNELVLICR